MYYTLVVAARKELIILGIFTAGCYNVILPFIEIALKWKHELRDKEEAATSRQQHRDGSMAVTQNPPSMRSWFIEAKVVYLVYKNRTEI